MTATRTAPATGGDDKDKGKPRPADPRERLRPGDRGVPARTGDNTAAWAAAGGVVLNLGGGWHVRAASSSSLSEVEFPGVMWTAPDG